MFQEKNIWGIKKVQMYGYNYNGTNIHDRNAKNAIVMLSGGVDSTVALTWAMYKYDKVKAITLDYNQPHRNEIEYAKTIAKLLGVEHDVIKIDFPQTYWGIKNRLTRGQAGLSAAIAAIAISHAGADIVLGILTTDNFRDCDRDHLDRIADVLFHPDDDGEIGIATPLKAFAEKRDVISFGYEIGAPLKYTWTCRNPIKNKPCQVCAQCLERKKAFDRFFKMTSTSENDFLEWQGIPGGIQQPRIVTSNYELEIFAKAFIKAGGFQKCKKGLMYEDSEGEVRISSIVSNQKVLKVLRKHGKTINIISASGFNDKGYLWEVCLLEDGTIAATDYLPDMEVVENVFVRKLHS